MSRSYNREGWLFVVAILVCAALWVLVWLGVVAI